jgi:gentisate 1,2-dioxygenase
MKHPPKGEGVTTEQALREFIAMVRRGRSPSPGGWSQKCWSGFWQARPWRIGYPHPHVQSAVTWIPLGRGAEKQ